MILHNTARTAITLIIGLVLISVCGQHIAFANGVDDPIFSAVERNRLDDVQALIDSGANVNARNGDNASPLLIAADRGNIAVVHLLLQHGAAINYQCPKHMPALHTAVDRSNFDLIRYLIKSGADVNLQTPQGYTAMHVAVINNRWGEAEVLMEVGANTEIKDQSGMTPLHFAVANRKIEVVRSMLTLGASTDAKNQKGETVMEAALAIGWTEGYETIARYRYSQKLRAQYSAALKVSSLDLTPGYCAWSDAATKARHIYSSKTDGAIIGNEWFGIVPTDVVKTTASPNGTLKFLGEFGNQAVHMRLMELPEHSSISIQFDLIIAKRWIGDHYWDGPSLWSLGLLGGPILLYTSFATQPRPGYHIQSFPDGYPGGHHDPNFNSMAANTLGYKIDDNAADAIYHVAYTFHHHEPVIVFEFKASGLRALDASCWGLNNVEVSVGIGATGKKPN